MTFSELSIGDAFLRRSELFHGNLDWVSSVHVYIKHTDTEYRTLGQGWGLCVIDPIEEIIRIHGDLKEFE